MLSFNFMGGSIGFEGGGGGPYVTAGIQVPLKAPAGSRGSALAVGPRGKAPRPKTHFSNLGGARNHAHERRKHNHCFLKLKDFHYHTANKSQLQAFMNLNYLKHLGLHGPKLLKLLGSR